MFTIKGCYLLGQGAVDRRNFAWHLANSGGGRIIGMEQRSTCRENGFYCTVGTSEAGMAAGSVGEGFESKGGMGEECFVYSFLKFEPGELLER